jgi:adenosylcobinamide hydrolase
LLNRFTSADDTGMTRDQIMASEIAREGLPKDFFGLVSPVKLHHLCILNYDFITAFITAGRGVPATADGGVMNIIISSSEGLTDGALISAIISVSEARLLALQSEGIDFSHTMADGLIIAGEGEPIHSSAGPATEPGKRMKEAVRFGIAEALKRSSESQKRDSPSFFILSRYGGEHWVEWLPEQCPYYPCHFEGQRCDFCYCPFYPCGDETLGHLVKSSSQQGMVWNCAECTLLHHPEIAKYLKKFPEASLRELKSLEKKTMTGTSSPR